jgi:hypothetical protein
MCARHESLQHDDNDDVSDVNDTPHRSVTAVISQSATSVTESASWWHSPDVVATSQPVQPETSRVRRVLPMPSSPSHYAPSTATPVMSPNAFGAPAPAEASDTPLPLNTSLVRAYEHARTHLATTARANVGRTQSRHATTSQGRRSPLS